ncbi:MAG: hypothetical protein ACRYG7_13105 [Janthinobacterium lividum]
MPTPLTLVTKEITQPTRAVPSGAVYLVVDQGSSVGPLTVEIVGSPKGVLTPNAPTPFLYAYAHRETGLAPGAYEAIWYDAAVNSLEPLHVPFTIDPVPEPEPEPDPVPGCNDEYAANFDPAANQNNGTCTYAPTWRSAWGPARMPVSVAAVAGQVEAFVTAELRIGFREGHPLAAVRPLGEPVMLRATVGPDGFAVFRLAPYLWPALGSDDGQGGRRLDINSPTAFTDDLYVGYELRRAVAADASKHGEMLAHGYALNAAMPDTKLVTGQRLTPFYPYLPIWPGFDDYRVPFLQSYNLGKYGELLHEAAVHFDTYLQPCPSNPVPVAWLAPGGGFGYWVFSGRPAVGDTTSEGQDFNEALTGEARLSDPGRTSRTVKATSGVFRGDALLTGLRTLWASPQAWYQPVVGGEWVAILVEKGTRDVGRMGVARNEVPISFTEALPRYAQGQ